MITTVNLNPCIDKSIIVSQFEIGSLNRVLSTRCDISGKGINVAIAIQRLGFQVECIGFNYKEDGHKLENLLNANHIPFEFVSVEGQLRNNLKIIDMEDQNLTELNEKGVKVSYKEMDQLKQILVEHTDKSKVMVISGSVPPGLRKDIYRDLIENLSGSSLKVILDAENELLLEGIKAKPYLIKPNLCELETTFAHKCQTIGEVCTVANEILKSGVAIVCVSLGKQGAVICSDAQSYYSSGLDLEIKGIQGAGDAMVAGISVAIEKGLPVEEMLRYGMAASAASLILEGTQMCEKADFERYLRLVKTVDLKQHAEVLHTEIGSI